MSSDARVTLTVDESTEVECLTELLERSSVSRMQMAAELVVLRKLYAACRRDRLRLPVRARLVIDRFPAYSRSVEFHLQSTHYLELEP